MNTPPSSSNVSAHLDDNSTPNRATALLGAVLFASLAGLAATVVSFALGSSVSIGEFVSNPISAAITVPLFIGVATGSAVAIAAFGLLTKKVADAK
jgi:hypothetical protein